MLLAVEPHAPARMLHTERQRVRSAAHRAKRCYPGPVGEVLFRELMSWEEFGYRFGNTALVERLCDHVLRMPLPTNA